MDPRSQYCRTRRTILMLVAMLALVTVSSLALSACEQLGGTATSAPAATAGVDTTAAPPATEPPTTEAGPTTTSSTATTLPASLLSQESLDYARSLGGGDHYGETLWFVIGDEARTEAGAKALLEPAKAVGDMQSNFIVQLSDNFEGMRPGYWIVFEAYDGYPSEEDMMFCRRPFPGAYLHHSRVMTHDPIPVRPGG